MGWDGGLSATPRASYLALAPGGDDDNAWNQVRLPKHKSETGYDNPSLTFMYIFRRLSGPQATRPHVPDMLL